jgi:hypothetical protein
MTDFPQQFLAMILSFSVPIVFWIAIREKILESANIPNTKAKLRQLLDTKEVLEAVLNAPQAELKGTIANPIVINAEGKITVTAVLSLLCHPCATALEEMIVLSRKNRQIRFEVLLFANDPMSSQISRIALNKKFTSTDASAIDYLRSWYANSTQSTSFVKHEVLTGLSNEVHETIYHWQNWLSENKITTSPSIFIDKKLKPAFLPLRDFTSYFTSLSQKQYSSAPL